MEFGSSRLLQGQKVPKQDFASKPSNASTRSSGFESSSLINSRGTLTDEQNLQI